MSSIKCPKCGNNNPPDSVFCEECGQKLTKAENFSTDFTAAPSAVNTAAFGAKKTCPKCGASFSNDSVFCENCGVRLVSGEAPASAFAPSPAPAPAPAPAFAPPPAPAPAPVFSPSPAASSFAPPPASAGGDPAPGGGLKINMGHSAADGSAGQNDSFKPLNSFDE